MVTYLEDSVIQPFINIQDLNMDYWILVTQIKHDYLVKVEEHFSIWGLYTFQV